MAKIRRAKKESNHLFVILFVLVVLGIGLVLYNYWDDLFIAKPPIVEEQAETRPQQDLQTTEEPPVAAAVEPTETPGEPLMPEIDSCVKTQEEVLEFFSYLDEQPYLESYELTGGTFNHFSVIAKKLFANPPVVIRETDDLFAILKNAAHFYRVLGPKNISLIKDILQNEKPILEETMRMFYDLSLQKDCKIKDFGISLPLKGLYEYAGFFLNTLGGKSYLFRRDSAVRMLIQYYSILIIDRANIEVVNKYGIDIRQPIQALAKEMSATMELRDKDRYLEVLAMLAEKYEKQYGTN